MKTLVEEGQELFRTARRQVHEVADRCLSGSRTEEDAYLLKVAIEQQLAAVNRLEDTPQFEAAHQQLDFAGRVQRVFFPNQCLFTRNGAEYTQECPVAVGHLRLGVSIGAIVREAECSICSLEPEECSHISGRVYNGEECYRIIKRFDLDHVAIVERPDFPDTRFMSRPVPTESLIAALGPNFVPGAEVRCNQCLSKCPGVDRPAGFGSNRIVESSRADGG